MFCGRFVLPHSCVWPSQDSKVIGCELPQYRYWNHSDRAAWTVDRSAPTVRQGYRVDCAVDETLDISWSLELISCQWRAMIGKRCMSRGSWNFQQFNWVQALIKIYRYYIILYRANDVLMKVGAIRLRVVLISGTFLGVR